MRSALKITSVLAIVVAIFNSCKNDLKILAPYKESVSVYGILNPQDTLQIIRINKIFLGEGNAFTMAQVQDSVNYKAGQLTVTLERFVNGVQAPTTKFSTKTQIVLRDSLIKLTPSNNQVFNQYQRIYVTGDRLYNSGVYKLKIVNNTTSNTFTSQTTMVDTVKQNLAQPLASPFYPVPFSTTLQQYQFIDYATSMNKIHNVQFVTVKDAKEYSCNIRFYYADSCLGDPILKHHYIEFVIASQKSTTLNGNEKLTVQFLPDDLFGTVEGGIKKIGDPVGFAARRATHIDFVVTAAALEFSDFLQVSAPSTSVSQDKPAYSNISGGIGIFSSKSVRVFPKGIWNNFLDYMSSNKPLCSLGFLNSGGSLGTSCN